MGTKTKATFLMLILSATFLVGCIEEKEDFDYTDYSGDFGEERHTDDFMCVIIRNLDSIALVNYIQDKYDEGYEYIGLVSNTYNGYGATNNFMVFQKVRE